MIHARDEALPSNVGIETFKAHLMLGLACFLAPPLGLKNVDQEQP